MIQYTGFQNHSAAHQPTTHYMRVCHILDLCANCTGIHPRGGEKRNILKMLKKSYIRYSTQDTLYKIFYIIYFIQDISHRTFYNSIQDILKNILHNISYQNIKIRHGQK